MDTNSKRWPITEINLKGLIQEKANELTSWRRHREFSFKKQITYDCHSEEKTDFSQLSFPLESFASNRARINPNLTPAEILKALQDAENISATKTVEKSPLVNSPPEQLSGVTIRNVVNPENPVSRIMHISQSHAVSSSEWDFTPEKVLAKYAHLNLPDSPELQEICDEMLRKMESVADLAQYNIALALKDLIENHGLKETYMEGHWVLDPGELNLIEMIPTLDKKLEEARSGLRFVEEKLKNISPEKTEEISLLEKERAGYQKDVRNHSEFIGAVSRDASMRLFKEGVLKEIRPSELLSALKASSSSKLSEDDHSMEESWERREDIAIVISQFYERFEDGLAVIPYGRAHDFTNNIRSWNTLYPDQQIALTVLEPKSVEQLPLIREEARETFNSKIKEYIERHSKKSR